MKNIDWARKLTSRKFWAAIAAFVAGLIAAFGINNEVVVTVTGLVMSGGAMVAYIIGEGFADAAHTEPTITENKIEELTDTIKTEGAE